MAALLAAALSASPAFGQVQVQGGSGLDANQQVGSGGYNQASAQVDYRARNLLITGNVGGGQAFRGSINYRSEGSFQGNLGSDSLFNFNRDSIYSAPGSPVTGSYQAQSVGNQVIVTRPSTSVPGYLVNTGSGLSTRSTYDPSAGVVTFRQDGGGLVSISGVNDPSRLNNGGQSLGLVQTPQGLVNINASPLTGVRYNALDVNTGPNYLAQPTNILPQTGSGALDDRDRTPDNSLTPERRIDGLYQQAPIDNGEAGRGDDPLTITLGTQVQSALALQLAGRNDNNVPNAQAQNIRNQVFGQQTPQTAQEAPQAPQNPYDQLIANILAQANGEPPETTTNPQGQEDNRPRWQQVLDEPEQAILDAQRQARETSLRISLNMFDEQGNVDYDAELPTIDPDSDLGQLLSDLSYDLPRVNTLAGQDENRINTLMTRGEQELAAGRYIMSEAVYRQVLRETEGDPLAKAGLIHSQMGAGMIRSAAFNLRSLFSDHPELIALRYESNLLPDNDRLRELQRRLQTMINDGQFTADSGLILAYLGYQLEATPLIEFGLSVAEANAPRDPLMPVLRRIWLSSENAEAGNE